MPLPTTRGVTTVVAHVWRHPSNRGQRVARLVGVVRFQVRARVRKAPTTIRFGTRSRLVARLDNASSKRAVYYARPDHAEMRAWEQRLGPGALFVDVGANVGLYSLLALDAGAEVIACEPVAASRDQLEANLALNDYAATVLPVAVGAAPGQATMAGPDLNRMHLAPGGESAGSLSVDRTVEVRTLDDILGSRVADGVKIDVEGAERLVLEGGREALAEHRIRLLQLEWNRCSESLLGEDRAPVVELLRAAGYELCRPTADGDLRPVTDLDYGPDMFARPVGGD